MSSSRKTQYRARRPLEALRHSRAMLALIGPSAQTTTHDRIADAFRRAAQQPRQIRGPMGEDAKSDLVNHCHTSLSHSARQHDQQQDDQAPDIHPRPDPPTVETVSVETLSTSLPAPQPQ